MTAPAIKAQYRYQKDQHNSKATPAKSSPEALFVCLELIGQWAGGGRCHPSCCQRQRSKSLRTPRRSCPASHGAFPASRRCQRLGPGSGESPLGLR
jgi:hypothetical protein